jgi:hypothetical protein
MNDPPSSEVMYREPSGSRHKSFSARNADATLLFVVEESVGWYRNMTMWTIVPLSTVNNSTQHAIPS